MTQPPDFETLVATYYQPLFQFAISLAKSAEDAADLTQQTFLIWAKKGSSLRDPGKVKSWLFTTLYREFLRTHRRSKNVSAVDNEILQAHPDPGLIEGARQLEGNEALAALNELDPIFREPLSLFYLEDLAYKEISEILDIPMGTVMSRLSRGKAQLKTLLAEKLRK